MVAYAGDGWRMVTVEFQELNSNVRFLFDQYIRWVTFYNTANVVAWGWFVNQFVSDKTPARAALVVWAISIFFIIQTVLAIIGSRQFIKYVRKQRARMDALADRFSVSDGIQTETPFPFDLTERVIRLFTISFVPMIPLWAFIAVFVTLRAR